MKNENAKIRRNVGIVSNVRKMKMIVVLYAVVMLYGLVFWHWTNRLNTE